MKKHLSFLIPIIALVACKKDISQKPADIVGTWKWQATYKGGPTGPNNPLTPTNIGYTRTLVFKNNGEWYLLQDNTKIDSGTYTTGYGEYRPYSTAGLNRYDSIRYFRLGDNRNLTDPYAFNPDSSITMSGSISGRYQTYLAQDGPTIWRK